MIKIPSLTSISNTEEALLYKASLVDGKWHGIKNNKKYPIEYSDQTCNRLGYIFSSETNDYWPIGTVKTHTTNKKNYDDFGFWTPFKEGMMIKAVLIKGMLNVDWKHHQKTAQEIYGKSRDVSPFK